MIDKKTFEAMRSEYEQFDKLREELIALSRLVLKSSKELIYSLHRNDFKQAKDKLKTAQDGVKKIEVLVKKEPHLVSVGAYSDALEEYVEACCYFFFLTEKRLPAPKELNVDTDIYLPGLCDLVGELVRKAINCAIKSDYQSALEIRDVVSQIYSELLLFDFRNSPVRRKFDGIKYGLEKLEDLVFQLKVRDKIK